MNVMLTESDIPVQPESLLDPARLQRLRKLAGLSYQALAARANVHKLTVYYAEKGRTTRASTRRSIALALTKALRELEKGG